MFKRKDGFVPFDGYDIVDGRICMDDNAETSGRAVCKRLGIEWDKCVMWLGMPIVVEEGRTIGRVGNVIMNQKTGEVQAIETDSGATANTLLGKRAIPAEMIIGFRTGMGDDLATRDANGKNKNDDEGFRGSILVDDNALSLELEDGLAEKAGKTTAIATDKASKAAAAASKSASKAAKKTGEVVNKGAYAAGKQIGKTQGMFAAFKAEYDKARSEDDEDE